MNLRFYGLSVYCFVYMNFLFGINYIYNYILIVKVYEYWDYYCLVIWLKNCYKNFKIMIDWLFVGGFL